MKIIQYILIGAVAFMVLIMIREAIVFIIKIIKKK